MWITAFGIGIGVVYGLDVPNHIQCKNFTALGDAIYGGFYKLAWALAVGWVIFACCRGYGGKKIVNFVLPQMNLNKNIYKIIQLQGWVNDFLSWKAFVPFSRVSYIIYLVHQDLMRFLLGFHEAAIPGSVMMFVSDNFWF